MRRAIMQREVGAKRLYWFWHSPAHEARKAARNKGKAVHPGSWGLPRWIKTYRALQTALRSL